MDNNKQTTKKENEQENKIDVEKQFIKLEDDTSYYGDKKKTKFFARVYGCMIFTLLCLVSFLVFSLHDGHAMAIWIIVVVLLCCCGCYCYSKKPSCNQ